MSFYRYWAREHYLTQCRERAADKRRADRNRTREERRAREARRMQSITALLFFLLALMLIFYAADARALSFLEVTA